MKISEKVPNEFAHTPERTIEMKLDDKLDYMEASDVEFKAYSRKLLRSLEHVKKAIEEE